jgi:hypothetical protein
MSPRRRALAALICGSAVIAAGVLAVLLQRPPRIASTNRVPAEQAIADFRRRATVCQGQEAIPRSTQALRISVAAYLGPEISLTVAREGEVIARARRGSGWIGAWLTFPLPRALKASADATICLHRDNRPLSAHLLGSERGWPPATMTPGSPPAGRMRVEYLSAGRQTWLARTGHVAERLGLVHIPSTGLLAVALLALMALAAALAARLLLRAAGGAIDGGGGVRE